MRLSVSASLLVLFMAFQSSQAQQTLDFPVGERRAYPLDSGFVAAASATPAVTYQHIVQVRDALWLRVYFGEVSLGRGSYLRLTSLLDGEVQELSADGLMMWNYTSAYFNGDSVLVELVTYPNTQNNRLVIEEVGTAIGNRQALGGSGECGICGADDRVPSGEVWTARLLPAGCTASIYNVNSCMVTAGHCLDGTSGDVVQFNVPSSNPNCSLNHPPVADQFPIASKFFTNGGVGNDWGVVNTATNSVGQTIWERYGDLRPISSTVPPAGFTVSVTGYGVDQTCTLSQTQQFDDGPICSVFSTWYEFQVDLTGGNSGSALIHDDEIIGVVTHCPCCNVATRVDHPDFASAIVGFCGAEISDCCYANGTPGCDDAECEAAVCACDPFCCDTEWDSFCAGGGFEPDCGAAILCEELCTIGGCENDTDCDDGVFCNGQESCDQGTCVTGTPPNCDDGVPCTFDSCNEGTEACDNVPDDGACNDGLFCNGTETCNAVSGCESGVAVDCDDVIDCTLDSCNEGTDACDNVPDDGACDDGLFCNGTETCNAVSGCESGVAVDCDDVIDCTLDSCNEETDACDNVPDDGACDDGLFCNGTETCNAVSGCESGVAVDCDDVIDCTLDSCNEETDACDNVPDDGACNDGLFCNGTETCNAVSGCESGVAVDCDDVIDCTLDSCNEGTDACDNVPDDGACDDGLFCNGTETCNAGFGCESGVAVDCDDVIDCTLDSCNEGTDACDNVPDDGACDDGLFCNGTETCNAVSGCESGVAVDCDDVIDCTLDSCNEGTDACDNVPDDGACDDGLFCNGTETCNAVSGCESGVAVDCDDVIDCTLDSCNEGTDACDNVPDDGACDDGLFCNGTETCNAGFGCESGVAVDCDDVIDCTLDSCNEGTDACDNVPDDGACNDGLFCNGTETCNAGFGCESGVAVDCDDGVDCTLDSCNEGTDACDNVPDDGACDDGLFCNGTETCDPDEGCLMGKSPCPGEACDEDMDLCLALCPEDLDGSGAVDIVDLLQLLSVWGSDDPIADINNDGTVGIEDLLDLLAAWGPCM